MQNLFFMLRLLSFRQMKNEWMEIEGRKKWEGKRVEKEEGVRFFFILPGFCPKIVIFFGPFSRKKMYTRFFLLPKCPPIATILRPILSFTFFYSPLLGRGKMKKKIHFQFFLAFFYKKKNCDGVEAEERVENEKKNENHRMGGTSVRDDRK